MDFWPFWTGQGAVWHRKLQYQMGLRSFGLWMAPGGILGRSQRALGVAWGRFWALLGPTLGLMGLIWGRLGGPLEQIGRPLGHFGASLRGVLSWTFWPSLFWSPWSAPRGSRGRFLSDFAPQNRAPV